MASKVKREKVEMVWGPLDGLVQEVPTHINTYEADVGRRTHRYVRVTKEGPDGKPMSVLTKEGHVHFRYDGWYLDAQQQGGSSERKDPSRTD